MITIENTLREFPLVIVTVAKVLRKRRLWLVVRVNKGREKRQPDLLLLPVSLFRIHQTHPHLRSAFIFFETSFYRKSLIRLLRTGFLSFLSAFASI